MGKPKVGRSQGGRSIGGLVGSEGTPSDLTVIVTPRNHEVDDR